MMLDAHLLTTLCGRRELLWARKEVLMSTRKLAQLCLVMVLLQSTGIKVITYIKPIMFLGYFGMINAGVHAVISYSFVVETANT